MKKKACLLRSVLVVGAVLTAMPASISASILTDFDALAFPQGTELSTQISGLSLQNALLVHQGGSVLGFQAAAGLIDTTFAGQSPFDALRNQFITDIIPVGGDWKTDPSVPIVVQFTSYPVENLRFKIADINGSSSDPEIMTAKAFSDLAGTNLLETQILSNGGLAGDGKSDLVAFASTGIRRLEIAVNKTLPNSFIVGFGVDDLSYDAIPEPTSLIIWSLLGTLGIAIGWWRRRR